MAKTPDSPAATLVKAQIGSRIVEWRDERGWSQEQCAGFLGITRDRLSKYERGARDVPSFVWVKVELLGGDLRWIIAGKKNPADKTQLREIKTRFSQ